MSTLLALDPGLNNPAWALFQNGVLVHAQRTKIPREMSKLPLGQRCRRVASLVFKEVTAKVNRVDTLVIEWPQVYSVSKSKGDPNDLLPLVGMGMYFAANFDNAELITPTPRTWLGGQIPKATTGDPWNSARGQRIASRLSDAERACIIVSHDALDAVGLGLWHLGRFAPRRLLPGINDV